MSENFVFQNLYIFKSKTKTQKQRWREYEKLKYPKKQQQET